MPTLWKRIVFSFGSILSIGSVVLLVVALSTERWITGTTLCQTGVDLVNASNPELEQFTGHIYYGLFQGGKTRRCGLGVRRSKIYCKSISLKNQWWSHIHNFLHSSVLLCLVSLAFCIYKPGKFLINLLKDHWATSEFMQVSPTQHMKYKYAMFACFLAAVHAISYRAWLTTKKLSPCILEESLCFSFGLCPTLTHCQHSC
ncbi:clarin-2 [Triplophysa rosa]|uniref:Clarin-2 n=1 Tax=Triplophysa rosa TaxID=992332 RepID=A0A9W7WZ25_TRIRA|nr:clarin-2 [Triplophysa rosa]